MLHLLQFCVAGEPFGKERPATRIVNGRATIYTPNDTKRYEAKVGEAFRSVAGDSFRYGDDVALSIEVTLYYPIPKSRPKKTQQLMRERSIPPICKPDVDNCLKAIMDGLQSCGAFKDDSRVVFASVTKLYADEPRVEVNIYEWLD